MTSTRRYATMAAVIGGSALAGSALLLVESVGLLLALAFWAIAALLFGNWYRTSTTPARFETEATVAGAEADAFNLYWTSEGAKAPGVQAPQTVNAAS